MVQTCQFDASFVGLGQSERGPGRISRAAHREARQKITRTAKTAPAALRTGMANILYC